MLGGMCWELEKMQEKGVWKSTKRKKRKVKRCIYQSKEEVQEQKEDESRCEWKWKIVLEGGE